MNRIAQGAIVVSAWTLAVYFASPRSASACSCILPESARHAYDQADAVFVATATRSDSPFGEYAYSVHLEVDTVWKGDVERSAVMVAGEYDAASGTFVSNSCDQLPAPGDRTLVFATRRDGYFTSWTCSGTAAWTEDGPPALMADLVRDFGAGLPPEPSIDAAPPTPGAAAEPPRSTPRDGSSPRWAHFALGAALAAVALAAAAWRGRRRPRRAESGARPVDGPPRDGWDGAR